jgi:predicted transcriptional regulator
MDKARLSKRISVPLTLREIAVLQEVADKRDRSLSWVAAHAIRFYLAEMKKGSQPAGQFETSTAD